jgi:hypothetical protein
MRLRHKPTRPLTYSLSAPAHATPTVIDNANGYRWTWRTPDIGKNASLARSQSMRGSHRRRPRPDLGYRPSSGKRHEMD